MDHPLHSKVEKCGHLFSHCVPHLNGKTRSSEEGAVLYCGGRWMENCWNGVATWRWLANDDTCGICRLAFDGCCPDCKIPGDECPLVWGQCSHCFHIHCIMKWLNSQQVNQQCPMCRQEWKFRE